MARPDEIEQEIGDLYRDMSPEQRRCLISIITQEWVTSFPYYSKVIFSGTRAGAEPGPFTYTIQRGTEIRAFSYAFNFGTAEAAGFPANYIARLCDTNLGKPQETISGESVEMNGIAIMPVMAWIADKGEGQNSVTEDLSDGRFMALCSDAFDVNLQLNAGQQDYRLGIFPMLPGAGGLEGSGFDGLEAQAIQGGRLLWGNITNGRPDAGNFFMMPEGIVWLPAGKRDSQLNVLFRACRDVIAYSGGDPYNNATLGIDEAPVAGIRGYQYPNFLGFALMVHLKGRVVSKRSMVT